MARPVVTCVMVTGHQPERRLVALRAAECFRRQTYGPRKLLIVNQGEPLGLPDENIRELPVGLGRTLGELRNVALRAITDGLVLQWDDDDIYGAGRIAHQVATGWPCLLREQLLWNTITGEARVGSAAKWRWGGWPGSILHAADASHRYPPLPRHEDSEFASKFGKLRSCDASPADYIRTFTSGSTSGEQHFEKLLSGSRPLTEREQRHLYAVQWWAEHWGSGCIRPCASIEDVRAVLKELKWLNWGNARFVANLVAKYSLTRVLEIGTLHGVATCYFAATGTDVTTVDLPESAFNLPSVDDTLAACGLAAEIVRQPSREALAGWIAGGRQFDLIYVDGSHTLGDALTDLLLADLCLVPGGWLIVDDIDNADFPGVRTAWEIFLQRGGYERADRPNWGVARSGLAVRAAGSGGPPWPEP